MSSILKALKKLEAENAVARRDPVRIDTEILRAPPPESRISPMGIVLAAILFLCGATVTYVYMSRNRHPPTPSPQEPVSSTVLVTPSPRHGEPESPRGAAEADGKKRGPVPAPDDPRLSRHRPLSPTPGRQVLHMPPGERVRPTATADPEQRKAAHISHAAPAPQTPTLRVDGIAFQDGAEGVAVVNGVPVSQGESVEGARVVEVQRDRVLFSHGGKKIEVLMGKSNR